MGSGVVIQAPVLLGACQAGRGLVDIDVGEDIGGLVGFLGRRFVLVDGDGDGGVGDAFADQVSDALNDQGRLRGPGELVVLHLCVFVSVTNFSKVTYRS